MDVKFENCAFDLKKQIFIGDFPAFPPYAKPSHFRREGDSGWAASKRRQGTAVAIKR
jgi:hypothetical protein